MDQECAIVHMKFEHDPPTKPGAMSVFVRRTGSRQVVVLESQEVFDPSMVQFAPLHWASLAEVMTSHKLCQNQACPQTF